MWHGGASSQDPLPNPPRKRGRELVAARRERKTMDLGIRGRTALVSGASRGLGRACAVALAQNGVDVVIVARTRDPLEQAAAEIRAETGVRVTPVAGDITTPPGRTAALAACPRPDILVNNADGP